MAVKTNVVIWDAGGMDLRQTLFCGQSFSWQSAPAQPAGSEMAWLGTAGPYAAVVWQLGGRLHLARADGQGLSKPETAFWRRYFALDEDYAAIQAHFCTHKALAACVACAPGVRVLRQPFFDTLLSFLVSQNNHIPRISAIVNRLRQFHGPDLGGGARGFPTPEALAALSPEDLAELGAGYRAKYLIDAAAKVASGQVTEEKLAPLPDKEARALLGSIAGVGPKVADCVLLFGLGRSHIAPMDVWMKRAMAVRFPRGMPRAARGYEGIAQQYIFCWARENLARGS